MSTEEDACRVVVMNIVKGGWTSMLTIKIPSPALLGGLRGASGDKVAYV
jgi:hypothetical protein